ncbi:TMhelix containing protein [Vibrio phage 1.091.O._10N.286.52.B12]|nr:TMhelix containing protein [Vibrio phage 1.091.O._10N.286.52.B12]
MKSNNVRMQINRDLHAQFKRVDGDSNNERMKKLLDDSKDKYELAELVYRKNLDIAKWRCEYLNAKDKENNAMGIAVISFIVSVCSVAYVCAVNGWLS